MATSTRPSSPINVDVEIEHAIPVPPPSAEYFQVRVDRAPTPYPSGTPLAVTSQLDDETRAAVAREDLIDPVSAVNLLPLGDDEPLNVQVALARQAARSATQHLTRTQARLRAKADDVQRLEQEARDAAGRHAEELQLLTDELADLRSSYNAARFPVGGRSRIAPEEGEITPANGWEANDDRLPGFLIPGPDGGKVVAPYIKRTPEGTHALGSLGGPADPLHAYELYAAPTDHRQAMPDTLPPWLVALLTADTQAFPVLLQEAEHLDDWGLTADLERYHECEVRASRLSNEIASLQAEENYVLQKIRLSHYRLARADAGLRLACCEGLDPDFQQDYPEGRPGGYPIRRGKKFKGQGRPFVK